MSKEPWYKYKKYKKEQEKFPSAYIWSRFSCCYLSGGTQCSVVITGLLIFTVYFFIYYILIPRKTWPTFLFWTVWGSQPCTFCFLSDATLSNEEFLFSLMYIHYVMLVDLFAAKLTYSFDLSFLDLQSTVKRNDMMLLTSRPHFLFFFFLFFLFF